MEASGVGWPPSAVLWLLGRAVPAGGVPVACAVGEGRPASAVLVAAGRTASCPPLSRPPEPGTKMARAATTPRLATTATPI